VLDRGWGLANEGVATGPGGRGHRSRGREGYRVFSHGTAFVQLSCEIAGHPLGGGMLKLELREAAQIVVPDQSLGENGIANLPLGRSKTNPDKGA